MAGVNNPPPPFDYERMSEAIVKALAHVFSWKSGICAALLAASEYAMLSLIEDAPRAIKFATMIFPVAAFLTIQFEAPIRRIWRDLYPISLVLLTVGYLGFGAYVFFWPLSGALHEEPSAPSPSLPAAQSPSLPLPAQFRHLSDETAGELSSEFENLKPIEHIFGISAAKDDPEALSYAVDFQAAFSRAGIEVPKYWQLPANTGQKGIYIAVRNTNSPPPLAVKVIEILRKKLQPKIEYIQLLPELLKPVPHDIGIPPAPESAQFIIFIAPNPRH